MTTTVACAACGKTMPAGASFCPGCGASMMAPAPDYRILERLRAHLGDRYDIEKELGRGGMATVFLAQDKRHERPVAIKVLHPELAESMGAERFLREIRVAAKLQHPHILSLYDSGEADGLLFYVMPFVSGESLRDRIDREQMLPVDDAIMITLEVADALGSAHAAGVIHRDIKPENILLANGHALVADFGIARAMTSREDQKLTQTGTAIGTPLYMSPEQSYGEDVGPTADLYSLACVSYEMLTGQPPFTGANARAIMARHTMEMVPGLRLVRETVPEEVEEALLAALAKVPADRPQTAAQFAEMLGTPLGATSTRRARSRYVTAPKQTAAERPGIGKRAVMIAAALFVVLAGGIGAWMKLKAPAAIADGGPAPDHIAVLYFDDRSPGGELAFLANGLTEGLIDALGSVRELTVVSRGGSAQYRGSGLGTDSIARALGVGTLVQGSIEPEDDGQVRVNLNLTDASGAPLERASFALPLSNALGLADTVVQRAAALVRTRLGREIVARSQRQSTSNVEAWVRVQRAEMARKQADSSAGAGDLTGWSAKLAAADSILAAAEQLDNRWTVPVVQRAAIAYTRSRGGLDNLADVNRWITIGLEHVNRALAIQSRNPDALELRGNLQYWKYLLELEPDPARLQRLLDSAQADLERAVGERPAQAGAWATLSHLYNRVPSKTAYDIQNAARNALDADAFLSNADVVRQRLFFSLYDQNQFAQAQQHCREGARRFPDDWRFRECKLFVMTMAGAPAAVPHAWALRDSILAVVPEQDSAYRRRSTRLLVGAVIARAAEDETSLRDSASRVIESVRWNATIDPSNDLANLAAFAWTLAGDKPKAVSQLTAYLAVNPSRREAYASDPGWWFTPLADDPAYRRLVTSR